MVIKKALNKILLFLGNFSQNFLQVAYLLFRFKFNFVDFLKYSNQFISSVVLPIAVIAIAMGVVLAVQLGPEFVSRGMGNQMGILATITMTRELIPIVGSFMIATQYGTGFAAELAHMKISEQIDALKVLKVNPLLYLVAPRVLAVVVFAPILLWLASIVAVVSCYITIWTKMRVNLHGYLNTILDYLKVTDILLCMIKSAIFGAIIMITATTIGLETQGGAREVGKSTTNSVILAFILIVIFDYLITAIYL